jgi:hypothetical protein
VVVTVETICLALRPTTRIIRIEEIAGFLCRDVEEVRKRLQRWQRPSMDTADDIGRNLRSGRASTYDRRLHVDRHAVGIAKACCALDNASRIL